MIVRKRQRELLFQRVWIFGEGITFTPHPACVLAHGQVLGLHTVSHDHTTYGRHPQRRFNLLGSAIDEARVFQSCGFAPPAERERKTIGLFISQEDVGRLLAHVRNNCETPSLPGMHDNAWG
jgi:hypothetical protein